MDDVKRILLPTDFSFGADQALAYAIRLGERFGEQFHVLHVVERDSDAAMDVPLMEELMDAVQKAVLRADWRPREENEDEKPLLRCAVRAHHTASEAILNYIDEHDIDLVVMSPVGHSAHPVTAHPSRLGRTADRVVRLAASDVLTTGRAVTYRAHGPRRILVPVDFSPASVHALTRARHLARTFDASLTVMHVQEVTVFPVQTVRGGRLKVSPVQARDEDDLAMLYGTSSGPDVHRQFRVDRGRPAHRIARYAAQENMHLIVQGSRGRTGLDYAMLGSVAEGIMRRAECPVLTVKHPAARVDHMDLSSRSVLGQDRDERAFVPDTGAIGVE